MCAKCIKGGFYFIRERREGFSEEMTMEWQFEGRVVFNCVCIVGRVMKRSSVAQCGKNELTDFVILRALNSY